MTTQTRVLPELDEALDFDPTCESPCGCDRTAEWYAELTCGCSALACGNHKRIQDEALQGAAGPGTCTKCWARSINITWRPL